MILFLLCTSQSGGVGTTKLLSTLPTDLIFFHTINRACADLKVRVGRVEFVVFVEAGIDHGTEVGFRIIGFEPLIIGRAVIFGVVATTFKQAVIQSKGMEERYMLICAAL